MCASHVSRFPVLGRCCLSVQVAALASLPSQTPAAAQALLDAHDAELGSIRAQLQQLLMAREAEHTEW